MNLKWSHDMSQKQSEHVKQIALNNIDFLQIQQTYGAKNCSKTTLFVINWKNKVYKTMKNLWVSLWFPPFRS